MVTASEGNVLRGWRDELPARLARDLEVVERQIAQGDHAVAVPVDDSRLLLAGGHHTEGNLELDLLAGRSRRRTVVYVDDGVREDLGRAPVFPKPLPYRYTLRDALPWIVRGKYGPTWKLADAPSPTVSAHGSYNPVTSHQGLELAPDSPQGDPPRHIGEPQSRRDHRDPERRIP